MLAVADVVSREGLQNKIGHLAHRHRRLLHVAGLSARGISIGSELVLLCIIIEVYLWFTECTGFSGERNILLYVFMKCFNRVVVVKQNKTTTVV